MDYKIVTYLAFLVFLFSCNGEKNPDNNNTNIQNGIKTRIVFDKPSRLQSFVIGTEIELTFHLSDNTIKADSFEVNINGIKKLLTNENKAIVKLDAERVGMQVIQVVAYFKNDSIKESLPVIARSDIKPQEYSYKILQRYKHDVNDYTQGLVYKDGYMFEGTGQPGESMLKKYKPETGELMLSYKLPNEDFGEGVVLYKDFIYQLTWQSGVAYKYEAQTFKQLNRFVVQTEGWGIANYNDNLIMSDGSNVLYMLSPESFDVIKRIEVYDNIGPVNQLNELENIEGKIFANVYLTDKIVIIDPETGKVEGKINLEGLLNENQKKDADVLNGIAWKGEKNKIFVTGKWWPEMFYIQYQ